MGALSVIEQEGLKWLQLVVSGNASREDLVKLHGWRSLSPEHDAAFMAAARIHSLVGQARTSGEGEFVPSLFERQSTRRTLLGAGVVTGFAGFGLARPPLGLWPSFAELTSDYRTGVGERWEISIQHAVAMDINTRTSVSRLAAAQKGIELVSGEIAITAGAGNTQPFLVKVGGARVKVDCGTFDVRYDSDTPSVTCVAGSVQVAAGTRSVVLQPGHRLSADGLSSPQPVESSLITAWQHGQLIFHNEQLATVIGEINRYRHGRIVIVSAALAQSRFSGDFSIAQIDEAVTQIQRVANARATRFPGDLVVLS